MKFTLISLIVILFLNNSLNAQSTNITIADVKYNVNTVSKLIVAQQGSSGFDYLQITIDGNGNRWFCLSWSSLAGLKVTEEKYSMETAVKFFDMVYNNYNYSQNNPMNKIQFRNALKGIKIKGIQTITKNNVFYLEWQELVNKSYL